MQKPRIPPHPTTKQEILFLRRMGFPAQKKMNIRKMMTLILILYGIRLNAVKISSSYLLISRDMLSSSFCRISLIKTEM